MLKKLVVGTLAAGVVAGMLFGVESISYMRTFGHNVRQAVKSEITSEFEMDRIRHEVDNLMPEIRSHMAVVAEQSVDVKDLEREIADRESTLSKQREAILTLRSDLDTGRSAFTYRAVSYSRDEVEADLVYRFDAFRATEESLKRDRKILIAQRDTLHANQQKLDTMLGRKQDLIVKVAQLEARLKQVQAAETVNSIEIDDCQLAQVENMIKQMNHALDVRESLLQTEGHLLGRIPVDAEDSIDVNSNIASEIDTHFGLKIVIDQEVAEVDVDTSI
jgi:peptidoglycan hydrolase CwlO-like protein